MYLKLFFFMLIFISCSKGESTSMTKKKNKNLKSLIKPDYLKSGDTIAIIAPSEYLIIETKLLKMQKN